MYSAAPPDVTVHFTRFPVVGQMLSGEHGAFERASERNRHAAAVSARLLSIVEVQIVAFMHTTLSYPLSPETDETFSRRLSEAAGAPVTTAAHAIIGALGHLRARRISIVTPYSPQLTAFAARHLSQAGLKVLSAQGLGCSTIREIMAIDRVTLETLIRGSIQPGAEAIVISGTACRAMSFVDELEESLGLPVVTANQAAFWYCMRVLGVDGELRAGGVLLSSR